MMSLQGYKAMTMSVPGTTNSPNEIFIVLKPQQLPQNTSTLLQMNLLLQVDGVTTYLPIYTDYADAVEDYPNDSIYALDLSSYKKELAITNPI